jgi:hypothetical protein
MLVKQHWGAGWQIRRRGTISAVRLELWRANFRRFVVDYRRQYAVRVCAARDRDVAGHDLGHKFPFTTRINADGEAALGIPHSPSVPKDEVQTTRRGKMDARLRQPRPMCSEPGFRLGMARPVYVEDRETGCLASPHADQRPGVPAPKSAQRGSIIRSVFVTSGTGYRR